MTPRFSLLTLLAALALSFTASPAPAALAPLPPDLGTLTYPYPVQFLTVTAPPPNSGLPLRMAYMDIAARGAANGETVLLLHGKNFAGYSPYWDGLIDALAGAGYRVIVPDQIGWGKSSKPDIAYRFSWLAANTTALLDTLHVKRAVVFGHSTGGMLAAHFAILHPERVSLLVLEDPVGLEDYRKAIPAQTDETLYQAELKNTDPAKLTAFYNRYFALPRPELAAQLAEVPIRVTLDPGYPVWAKASARAYQMIYTQPVRKKFRKIEAPTLLVVGEQDRVAPLGSYAPPEVRKTLGNMPALGLSAARAIPHARLVTFHDCGHIPHLEYPDEFKAVLFRFLSQKGEKGVKEPTSSPK